MTPSDRFAHPTLSHLAWRAAIYGVVSLVGILAAVWWANGHDPHYFSKLVQGGASLHGHAPDLDLLARQEPVILVHVGFALAAFGLGAAQFALPKGTLPHRTMGWIWLLIMATVAGSSFFIRRINHGHFSLIHILSLFVLLQIPLIIWAARTHRIKAHANTALGLFMGALVIAGLLAFMPGRLMWRMFFG
jgi:uncharacterized membrane protein